MAKLQIYSPEVLQLAVWKAAVQLLAAQRPPPPDLIEPDWQRWLHDHFPAHTRLPMAERHVNLWEWFEALTPGVRPVPRVEIWPRAGGKSTGTELGVVRVGRKLTRRFVLYVSNKQDQANKHVQDIGLSLESIGIGRGVNLYGQAKGWHRSELRTASGFNVMAYGLDTALRGIKVGEFRPDLIIFDDVDQQHESVLVRKKKIETITKDILPAGSNDLAVLFVQNLIHEDSIAAQLAGQSPAQPGGTADWLRDREIGAFEPAVRDLEYDTVLDATGKTGYVITGGEATWEGQSLAQCQVQMNTWGALAFEQEAQHRTDLRVGGLWDQAEINLHRLQRRPPLEYVIVAVDPNIKQGGDAAGIIVVGKDARDHGYTLADKTVGGGPKVWAEAAVTAYYEYNANELVAESNQGGEMVEITIQTVKDAPHVELVHASDGKLPRAVPVQKLYADARIHHVGWFGELEKELTTWAPGMPSPNRLDALVWGYTKLFLAPSKYQGWMTYARAEQERMAALEERA